MGKVVEVFWFWLEVEVEDGVGWILNYGNKKVIGFV